MQIKVNISRLFLIHAIFFVAAVSFAFAQTSYTLETKNGKKITLKTHSIGGKDYISLQAFAAAAFPGSTTRNSSIAYNKSVIQFFPKSFFVLLEGAGGRHVAQMTLPTLSDGKNFFLPCPSVFKALNALQLYDVRLKSKIITLSKYTPQTESRDEFIATIRKTVSSEDVPMAQLHFSGNEFVYEDTSEQSQSEDTGSKPEYLDDFYSNEISEWSINNVDTQYNSIHYHPSPVSEEHSSKLDEIISQYNEQITRLNEVIDNYNYELSKSHHRIEGLNDENKTLYKTSDSLKFRVLELETRIDSLEACINYLILSLSQQFSDEQDNDQNNNRQQIPVSEQSAADNKTKNSEQSNKRSAIQSSQSNNLPEGYKPNNYYLPKKLVRKELDKPLK